MVEAPCERIAIIPARGGSKRVPRKNVRELGGRPLVAWAIDTCLRTGVFDRMVVSTDDDEVARVARDAGAEVPFIRSADLSDDHTTLVPVVADALERLGVPSSEHANVCCVYPTAIGLEPDDLVGAGRMLETQDLPYVIGVVRYGHPIQRALARDATGSLTMIEPEHVRTRTQDLIPRWFDAGQFVWGRAAAWATHTDVLGNATGYEMPGWRAVDLDTEDDWRRAQLLLPLIHGQALG